MASLIWILIRLGNGLMPVSIQAITWSNVDIDKILHIYIHFW